jgi:tRNA(fMet)-specific endonuclease VapC
MRWLLDTNAWIDYLKNPASAVRARLMERSPEEVLTCAIVRAELEHGARKYGIPERRLMLVCEMLAPYRSLPFDDAAAERYGKLRHELELSGERIGPHDLLIAAICLVHDVTLVTANTGEFARVANLRIANWAAGEN